MSNQGTSREYLHRRIARDFPEVIENDEIGKGKKYATPYIAAKALGIVKRSPSLELKGVESDSTITFLRCFFISLTNYYHYSLSTFFIYPLDTPLSIFRPDNIEFSH